MNVYTTSLRHIILHFSKMDFYEREVAKGCARHAFQAGDIALHAVADMDGLRRTVTDLQRRGPGVHGIVVNTGDTRLLRACRAMTTAVVNVANARSHDNNHSVHTDDVAVGRMAGEYLHSLGFRHFVYLDGATELDQFSRERYRGFRELLDTLGYRSLHTTTTRDLRWRGIRCNLPDSGEPVALFAAVDSFADLAAGVCRLYGVDVPGEVAILGVDDNDLYNAFSHYGLSSIRQDPAGIGQRAVELLNQVAAAQGRAPDRRIVLPPLGLVKRSSTDVQSFSDWLVARALRLIRDNAHRPLNVAMVARMLNASRRTLERRFRAALNTTVHERIVAVKLSRAEHLLRHTDVPIEQVAYSCGFEYPHRLRGLIRQAHGMSPSEYRQSTGTELH